MNIQYSTELKDRVQIKDGKNKNVKRIYKWKVFVCVCVVLCYNKNVCTLRMAHGHVVKNNAYKSND